MGTAIREQPAALARGEHHGSGGDEGSDTDGVATPTLSPGRQAQNFARHFFEMCVPMCVGGSVLKVLFFGGASLVGYPGVRERYPEVSLLVIAFMYVLPMAAWMRYRGMGWRPNIEMSGAAIGLAILVIGLSWLGIIHKSSLGLWQLGFCIPACPVMIVVMLFRLDLYTGRAGHHLGHRTHVAHAA